MEPLRTAAVVGTLAVLAACRSAGGSGVSNADELEDAASLGWVAPEFQPALEAVQAAVEADDDATARAALDRVFWRGPTGKTLAVAEAFERVLDGRAALAETELALEIAPEPRDGRARPEDPDLHGLWFVARNRGAERVRLAPGPATLTTLHERLDARAAFSTTSAVRGYETLRSIPIEAGGEHRTRLLVFFLRAGEGALAERMTFRLDLRAGTLVRGERELPAQRFDVAASERVALSAPLAARGPARKEELVELVRAGHARARDALDLALRLPPEERGVVLDELAPLVERMPDPDLAELVPALRWLARDAEAGGAAAEWRALLRERTLRSKPDREGLVLPRLSTGAGP